MADDDRLRREAETFYAMVANNPFGIYVVDADFTLRQISRGAERVFANVDPLIGRDLGEVLRALWPEPFASEAIGHFRATLATGISYEAPSTVEQRADIGVSEAYDWRLDRLRLPDGRDGVVCYFYDLTERHAWQAVLEAREAQLRKLSAELEHRVRTRTAALTEATARLAAEIERREEAQAALLQSQKLEAIGQLTAGVAHDFNNIITGIQGAFRLIASRGDDPRTARLAEMGMAAATRGAAIVQQLTAFARQQRLDPEPLDLATLFDEARMLIGHAMGSSNIGVDIAAPAGVWSPLADATQLQTALLNLAVNARDAMAAGGTIRIAAANSPAGSDRHPAELASIDAVAIRVADTGSGMAPDVLQRVMEPFFTTKGVGQGTGLGLAMVHGFIRQSGGTIRIESRVGEGSAFTLFLPRAESAAATTAPPAASAAAPQDTLRAILLVDDDASVLGVVAEGLADLGFVVHAAADAAAALDLTASHAIDAVVTDVAMPEVDGVELVRRLRATRPELPCLFITGHNDPLRLRDEVVVAKPFTPRQLADAIGGLLGSNDQRIAQLAKLDRLADRLRSDATRSLFAHWRRLLAVGSVPAFADYDPNACADPDRSVVAAVDLGRVPIEFTMIAVGAALGDATRAAATSADLPVTGSDSIAAREAAYRRCALTGRPSFEYARFDLGEGSVESFERLLLPFSTDGYHVDRIVGAVVFAREIPEGSAP